MQCFSSIIKLYLKKSKLNYITLLPEHIIILYDILADVNIVSFQADQQEI